MNVFELKFDLDNCRSLEFKTDADAEAWHNCWLKRRNGEVVTTVPCLNAFRSKHGARGRRWQSLVQADAAYLASGMLTLNARSMESLRDLLEGCGCFVSILPEELGYQGFFVTNTVDALDQGRSSIERLRGSQTISKIVKYQLHGDKISDQSIFYLKGLVPEIFVTDRFVERVEQNRITGFQFDLIWSGTCS